MKKVLSALFAFAFLGQAQAANIPYYTGPQDVANLIGYLNSLANAINNNSGGSGTPGGTNGQLQYNNGGAFGGATIGTGLSLTGTGNSAVLANTVTGVQNNLGATSSPGVGNDTTQGYSVGSLWTRSDTGQVWVARSVATGAAAWDSLAAQTVSDYIPTWWYSPFGASSTQAGVTVVSGTTYCTKGTIGKRITINALGIQISTTSAGGHVELGVYSDGTSTLTFLGNVGGILTTATGSLSSTFALGSGTNIQFEPGVYWFCAQSDNAVSAYDSLATTGNYAVAAMGTATLANAASGTNMVAKSWTGTYGTWLSTLTLSAGTDETTRRAPNTVFQVSSQP